MWQDVYSLCVNGELRTGDLVISAPGDAYGCLIGRVTQIEKLDTPEHETDNTTDDVHVNFNDIDYSDKRIAEIEAAFTKLYRTKKEFGECPIDDVIMDPDCLIRITGIEAEKLEDISLSYDNAGAFCFAALRTRELIDRLNQNLSDYHDTLLILDKNEIIGDAGMIAAVSDAHYYLTENHVFEESEVEYLLLFERPLEVVADKWCERTGQMDDFTFALDEVFDKKSALLGGYELYKESLTPKPSAPKPSIETPVDIKQAARHEAERLLHELKNLQYPNHPDNMRFAAEISPEYIKMAGGCYGRELIAAFRPSLPITFGYGQDESKFLVMTDEVRTNVQVIKPSIMEQIRESTEKAAEHNALASPDKQKRRDSEVL